MGANEDLTIIRCHITQDVGIAVDDVDGRQARRRPYGLRRRVHPTELQRESQGGAKEERLGVGVRAIQNATRRCIKGQHDLLESYFM